MTSTPVTPQLFDQMFRFLEMRRMPVVQEFLRNPNAELISQIKKVVKCQRKVLAKKYHPDLNKNPLKNMKDINSACDLLLTLRFVPIPPPPPQEEIIIHFYTFKSGGWGTESMYSNSSSTYYWR